MARSSLLTKNMKAGLLNLSFLAGLVFAIGVSGITSLCIDPQTSYAASPGIQGSNESEKQNLQLKKHILVVTSQPYLTDWFNALNTSLRHNLFSHLSPDSKLSYEFIGSESLTDEDYDLKLMEMLLEKYAHIKLDMVIAVMPVSSQFMLDHGEAFLPGIATVFVLPSKQQYARIAQRPHSGLVKSAAGAIPDTIERIHVLLPDTEQLLVVSGSGMDDLNYQLIAEDTLKNKGWPKAVEYLKGLTAEELAARLEILSPHSAVLMLTYLQDAQGKPLTTVQVMNAVSKRTAAPIFSFYDTIFGLGIVGGKLTSAEAYGDAIADTAMKMFQRKETPRLLETMAEARDIYDWRQMERWKIPQSRLPGNSDIRFRKVTFWEEHMGKIMLVFGIMALETFLILALLFNLVKRKRAETALGSSEKKYHDIFDNAVMGIFQSAPEGRYMNVNPALARLFGYPTPEEMMADIQDIDHEIYVNPEDRTKLKNLFASQGNVQGFQVECKRKDGSQFWISITGTGIRDHAGGILYYEGTIEDITQQKQAELELQKYRDDLEELVATRTAELASAGERIKINEERYGFALEASRDGLWDWDIKNSKGYFNPSYYRMLGYEPEELGPDPQSHWVELLHPEEKESVLETIRRYLESEGAFEIEFRMRTRDGKYKWILSRGKVVARDENDRPARAVGTNTDLTVRKQLELELRRVNEEQHAIVEMATTGIVLIRNRIIVRCNKKMEEIFGYDSGELVGKTTGVWYENDDLFVETGRVIAKQVEKTGFFFQEWQLVRKDGTRFWARMSARGISPRSAPLELVGIVEDITAERETMETLRQAKERAESADRLKSAFLATMSHELRTPLNSIIGFTGILLQRLGGPLNDEQDKQLRMVYNSAKHLLDLINDVLDISKIEAEQLNIVHEEFNLRESVEKVIKSSHPLVDKKGIGFSVSIAPEIGLIKSDRRRVEQILLNLLSNAVKFTEEGFIRMDCRFRENKIIIAVSDSGIGIKPEDMGALFNAFHQIESGITRKYDGTGLGLSICEKLARLLGGEIEVESVWGKGSTFRLILPLEGEKR